MAATSGVQVAPALQRAIVKQVLSGGAVIVRGQPRGGPPPERQINLSNVRAPTLARRAGVGQVDARDVPDEPWAFPAREFLRRKLIGKEVCFVIEHRAPGGREYGIIFLGKDTNGENVAESLISEGLVAVRREGIRMSNPDQARLCELEEQAKVQKIGMWSDENSSHTMRDMKWVLDNPRHFVDSFHQKPVNAIVEHVRDGCTLRALLLPSHHMVTVMLSGIKCPMTKRDTDGVEILEPYAAEAKFFTESRLLQRDVQIVLEGVSNQNLLGTIMHPNGNITELLLQEGFARCVDWSMGVYTQGAEKLRAAEREAKERKLRLWKDYVPPTCNLGGKERQFTAKVVQIVNADAIVVKTNDGELKAIHLSSIRPPRMEGDGPTDKSRKLRPLYDIPYMFEAREFLRKKLVGKKVNVSVDYVRQATTTIGPTPAFPERTCATVTISGVNIAEALVSKGYATVIRYRQDDDQRSAHYDELLAVESRAIKNGKGLHSKKEFPIHRVADISGDVQKAKQFFPFLQRAGRSEAVVEHVFSGSRLKLFLPKETCLITFLLAGIECPRGVRNNQAGVTEGEPYNEEATMFTKEMVLQREVIVEVEGMDKAGNFIGWLQVDGINLSVALVEHALSKVHFSAERSTYYKALMSAEEAAQQTKSKVWSDYTEKHAEEENMALVEDTERNTAYRPVIITEVTDNLHFYIQDVETGAQLEKLMENMRADIAANPPLPGAFTPRRGHYCISQFTDNEWYRAKIEKIEGPGRVQVFYVDYGNRESVPTSRLGALPGDYSLQAFPAQAHEYAFAFIQVPDDEEARSEAVDCLVRDVQNSQCLLNVEYRGNTCEHVTLLLPESREDVGLGLMREGMVIVENRKEKRFTKLVADYQKAQDGAKASRMNIWRYGDFTSDDAVEFGYSR